jgi:tetratricopeptide (TPR) repeat protein
LTSEERWNFTSAGDSHGSASRAADFYERAIQLDPNFAVAWARLCRVDAIIYPMLIDTTAIAHAARADAAKRALENAQKLEPDSPETLLALGYYQCRVLGDNETAKTTFERVSKMLPNSSEVPYALSDVAIIEGRWDEGASYLERALSLDPRNVELLIHAAWRYIELRQFPAALKLHDRMLDIMPNDPVVMLQKVVVYQAQGNLQEAAALLTGIDVQTAFLAKIAQLRLERNYGEAVRFLQADLAQSHYDTQEEKGYAQVTLASLQRLAGDTAGAKVTAEQARNTYDQPYREERHDLWLAQLSSRMSQVYALMGEKDLALNAAERAITLCPRTKYRSSGPTYEENLALIQTMSGENSRAISTLRQLLQTPYNGGLYITAPITPALLRLDPIWDPLRGDPAFQKLCEEKQK